MFNISYFSFEIIVAAEFVLVIFIVFLTYSLKIFFYQKTKNRVRLSNKIESFFTNQLLINKYEFNKNFPKKWRKLEILIPLIQKIDQKNSSENWYKLKEEIVKQIILPLAREEACSGDWLLRFYAAKAFSMHYEQSDEQLIIKLINDPIPLVQLTILKENITNSDLIMQEIIYRVSTERRLTQAIYLQTLNNLSQNQILFIEKILKGEENPYVRAICYRLFLNCYPKKITWNLENDLSSENLELKLAVIRFIVHYEKAQAIPLLTGLLNNPEWQVRMTSLIGLETLSAKKSIPEIANCLSDSQWWVRLHAAKALKKIGGKGMEILKAQSPEQDKFAFDIAQYVLSVGDK